MSGADKPLLALISYVTPLLQVLSTAVDLPGSFTPSFGGAHEDPHLGRLLSLFLRKASKG